MAEALPCYNFPAERLRDHGDHQFFDIHFGKPWVVTHTCNLIEIARRVYLQNLDCDLATLVFTHPHIGKPAAVQCPLRLVKTKRDLEWAREQRTATTYLAQCVQTVPLELRSQALQCLLGMTSGQ